MVDAYVSLEPAVDALLAMLKAKLPAALAAAAALSPAVSLPAPATAGYRTAFMEGPNRWRAITIWPTISIVAGGLQPHDVAEQVVLSWRGALNVDCFVKNTGSIDTLERQLQRYGNTIAALIETQGPFAGCVVDTATIARAPSENADDSLHARATRVEFDVLVYAP